MSIVFGALAALALHAAETHAVFSKAQSRQISHRWRPMPITIDDLVLVQSTCTLNDYCRAIIACERPTEGYGVLQNRPSCGLTLFIFELTTHVSGYVSHNMCAMLSSSSDAESAQSIRLMQRWHDRTLDVAATSVTDPRAARVLRSTDANIDTDT